MNMFLYYNTVTHKVVVKNNGKFVLTVMCIIKKFIKNK